MRQIRPDLWETRPDAPFPGLTTHAYLWTPPDAGNVLFYNTAGDDDLDEIADLGGVAHQYLSHQDEVAPMLTTYAERFGTVLHAAAAERHVVGAGRLCARRPGQQGARRRHHRRGVPGPRARRVRPPWAFRRG